MQKIILFCIFSLSGINVLFANNIKITNPTLLSQDQVANTVKIQFNVSWENSFRVATGPSNWDAAWIFIKYRVNIKSGGDNLWRHAKLAATGQYAPSGSEVKPSTEGAFIYRSVNGSGTFNVTGAQLQWNYGTHIESGTADFIDDGDLIEIQIFAIEMAYVPAGAFTVGDGSSSGFPITKITTGNAAAVGGYPTGLSNTNSLFPNGYKAFYCMKYEISQQQYVDFLNTLSYSQQRGFTSVDPSLPAGQAALTSFRVPVDNAYRNGIDIEIPGTPETIPAVYGCNLDGDALFNEANDGQTIACNYLSHYSLTGYLDWCGLRPMTELEFEKACRGPLPPVLNEMAWGNSTATGATSIINAGLSSESGSAGTNIAYNNAASVQGPLRSGSFAKSSTTRVQAGSTYYGVMDMSGNVAEAVVHVYTNPRFTGTNGNGDGAVDFNLWPGNGGTPGGSRGICYRGGSWASSALGDTWDSFTARVSFRTDPVLVTTDGIYRSPREGGRGVRYQ